MDTYVIRHQKKLRCGITTGTCAAAAARAAAVCLLTGRRIGSVEILTPKGSAVTVAVTYTLAEDGRCMEASVIKDSGDDPDVTNGAEIRVRVEKLPASERDGAESVSEEARRKGWFHSEEYPFLYLDGGQGVGRVTRGGLEQAIGQAAINRVPRRMIFGEVGEVSRLCGSQNALLITVFVPRGQELAKRTFNGRLGVEGGISILGTTGILEPMSERAIVDTIELEIRQRYACGERNLLITPGNYGRAYLEEYLHISMEQSVKCSNYIGEALDLAVACGMKRILLVGNIGKLCKLAAGIFNTHSRTADGRWEVFAAHTALCGGDRELVRRLEGCVNTEEMLALLEERGLREAVTESICRKVGERLRERCGEDCRCGAMLFSEQYGYLGETAGAGEIRKAFIRF